MSYRDESAEYHPRRSSYLLGRLKDHLREGGLGAALAGFGRYALDLLVVQWWWRLIKAREPFEFEGRRYRYFYRLYNRTWRSERAVEVPLARAALAGVPPERVLEVGNVLAHYGPVSHAVLDKYEQAPGILREDVVSFEPGRTYDRIVSISTIEHVGWDETPREPEKAVAALEHLAALLAPEGELLVTFPLGAHPELDRRLQTGELPFDEVGCLRRVSADNRWREVPVAEVAGVRYGEPWPAGNAIAVGRRRGRNDGLRGRRSSAE